MNKENTDNLFQRYPDMYSAMMRPDFECGDGWYGIIYQLSKELEQVAELAQVDVPKASQVKEKFGALRFYIRPVNKCIYDQVQELIRHAEELSIKTCEICGKSGKIRRSPYIQTLCDEHASEIDDE